MFLSSLNVNQNIGLIIMIIGIILCAIFTFLHFYFKNKTSRSKFGTTNRESQSVWEFTKKNFFVFVALFSVVFIISGIAMMITG
ncbi:hypothetical protein ESOMN_v1c06370 [Williamsoniiplasma somnilux]|uniref:Uncharacterized protein n=1 Tax=Williamsoniiplasma somnilux TaxID=215578 RepID=A0A2K8NYX1_9MOLU|nr:hypothetical protein [Williamsoniiplasma somnilux]ATZ19019.1 hypothetical protein ESOMN_v1c06370 [Williamsoniiplasma somnilux]